MTPGERDTELGHLLGSASQLFAASAHATLLCAPDGTILLANDAYLSLIDQPESAVVGLHFTDVVGRRDSEGSGAAFAAAANGSLTRYTVATESSPGIPFTAEIEMTPVRSGETVIAILATARNTSDSAVADRENLEGLGLLRIAGRMARFGGWSVDGATRAIRLSREARHILGLPLEGDVPSEDAWALHPEEWRPVIGEALDRCLTDGSAFDVESEMLTVTGSRIWVRTIGEAEWETNGTVRRARGALWDITSAVREREQRRQVEDRLQATLNTLSDGLFFLDADGRFTFINERGAELVQRPVEDLVGATVLDAFPEASETPFIAALSATLKDHVRTVTRSTGGDTGVTFETTMYPNDNGVAVYLRDVTDEELARVTALESQQKIEQQAALLDHASDAMIVRDFDGRVQYWNAAAADLYGWSADEAVGREIVDVIWTEPEARKAAMETLMEEGFFAGELQQRTRDGRSIIIDARWQLLTDQNGITGSIFAINTDITEYRNALEARLRAQRMESLGTLAGGIAHDLNNVLTPILMAVQLLEHGEDDPGRREILATMEGAVKRGADMIRQVLSFARGVEGKRVRVSISRLMDDLLGYARGTLPESITIEANLDATLPSTMGDPTQLLQILTNLVANARDAMEGRPGTLRVSSEVAALTDQYFSVSHLALPGTYIVIEVEDTGHGMPAEVVEKIFEPFFTTKEIGKGTGLGLATSLAIVRSHGGWMQVYSEQGNGTRFRVGLPIDEAAVPGSVPTPPMPRDLPQGHGELILIVDDEVTIRQITSQTLEANGYRTLHAANGREAIDIVESREHTVSLVLTDMMMPVMDGAATSAYLEEHFPEIPVIAASGLNSNDGVARAVGMGVARFLPKPYTTSLLLTTIRDTLLEHRTEGMVNE